MTFCHLHVHNEYSVLDGIGTSRQYSYRAKEMEQTHLALTNHANVDGTLEHQKQCGISGINPIAGCELYIVENMGLKVKGEPRYHLTVLVENQTGWRNLLQLLTVANLEGFYYRPRIDLETLTQHLEGLVVLTGCSNSFLRMTGASLPTFIDILGKDRVFLEVMPHQLQDQLSVNEKCLALRKRYGLRLVATNDCHYPTNRAAAYQEVLLAIQTRKKMSDKDRWRFQCDGFYLNSEEEMVAAFKKQKSLSPKQIREAMDSTMIAAHLCEGFRIEKQEPQLPCVGLAPGQTDTEKVKEIVQKGFESRLLVKDDGWLLRYRNRIEEELGLIENAKFERYFLIVWDLINWCRSNGIMTGPGRGSVGGSLVAYLMGITDVDPIKYNLSFTRFISPERIDLPDIDMDFENHKRHLVKKYLQDKYGEFNVAGLSTFMTMKGRGVITDVSRVYDVPLDKVKKATKSMEFSVTNEPQVRESFNTVPECLQFKNKYPEVVEVAEELEGQIRGAGQHAAAVCVSSCDLREGLNCNLSIRSGQVVANWDKDNAEYMGLIKLDILGLSALSRLNSAKEMILKNYRKEIDFNSIPLDDRKVFIEINKGNTVGAFQVGAKGLSKFCEKLIINNFEMLVAATALYRPGPLHSGMAEKFIDIKNGRKKPILLTPLYDEITKDTFGIIVYQEQVMQVVNRLSGIDMATCDKIRKLMAKSKGEEAINKYREEFIQGCIKNKTDKKLARLIWKTIFTFGKYGFNKAHSVEYSLITYWDMWLKVYYPGEFIACSMTYGDKDKFSEHWREARRLRLEVRLPKVGLSHATEWRVDDKGNLFAPFIAIKGIGESTAQKVAAYDPAVKPKQGFFQVKQTSGKIPGVNKTIVDNLEKMGSFLPVGEISKEERIMIREFLS